MSFFYPFFVAFLLVFISELGDKTQLLVLSFSNKVKPICILFGVGLGSFLSHGIAILFGSSLGLLENDFLHEALQVITYLTFVLFGILSFVSSKNNLETKNNNNFITKISSLKFSYVFIIALCIAIGEFGDKTFLASIGLGINYPNFKLSLIFGAIWGMIFSDAIALLLGKMLNKFISENTMKKFSGILFLIFGIIGILKFIIL